MPSKAKLYLALLSCMCTIKWGHSQNDDTPKRPHIIFIVADDLGWNDVGFHGSTQIPTPNIDALAYSGIILNHYYVTAICTPSRSALMTGKHPIHTGMQHTVLYAAEPRGLPLTEKLLPQYLRELGYTNRIVGKWHLGNFKREYTPLYRGFDSHLGFWTGRHDYFDHTSVEKPGWGLDMRRNMDVAWDLHGQYSTDIFTKEARNLILNHNKTNPLFLYLAHAAVHSGNPYNPLPCPDEAVKKFANINHYHRQRFAGMLSKLDDSVGEVVKALKTANMLENSLIVFTTDNGGPAEGFNLNAASNWPLRGVKNTLWEGGVRGAALLWSPMLSKKSRIATQRMHITDWLPTLYAAAGGNTEKLGKIDGMNLWKSLSEDEESERKEILHNIDDSPDYNNYAITMGDWKLLKGSTYQGSWDSWYGPSGRGSPYDLKKVLNSPAGKSLLSIRALPSTTVMNDLRKKSQVVCALALEGVSICNPIKEYCLYNITADPCEQRNLAKKYPDMVELLKQGIEKWNKTAVKPGNLPLDLKTADPSFYDYTWTNFGDFSFHQKFL